MYGGEGWREEKYSRPTTRTTKASYRRAINSNVQSRKLQATRPPALLRLGRGGERKHRPSRRAAAPEMQPTRRGRAPWGLAGGCQTRREQGVCEGVRIRFAHTANHPHHHRAGLALACAALAARACGRGRRPGYPCPASFACWARRCALGLR